MFLSLNDFSLCFGGFGSSLQQLGEMLCAPKGSLSVIQCQEWERSLPEWASQEILLCAGWGLRLPLSRYLISAASLKPTLLADPGKRKEEEAAEYGPWGGRGGGLGQGLGGQGQGWALNSPALFPVFFKFFL